MGVTMGSADSRDLIYRCVQVLKSGFIRAMGELVFDRLDGQDEKADSCAHLMDVHWFEAVDPPTDDGRVTGANCFLG